MGYYPIAIELAGVECLVVGGGEVALRKARSLLEAGACVTVVTPEAHPELERLAGVQLAARPYRDGEALGYKVVFACTDDAAVNATVAADARQSGALVNVADDPELCSFIAPSVVRRGDLMIAITTSGKSPLLSRRIREELECRFGLEYGEFLELLGEMREQVKAAYTSQQEREIVFGRLLDSGILELLREGKTLEAREKALKCIS